MSGVESPLFWVLAVAGVLLTGISKSGYAGGAGVVAVPLLALVMHVELAAALMLPLLIVMDAKTVYLYRDAIRLKAIKPILLASLIGISLAGAGMGILSSDALQIILGLFSLLFACWQQLMPLLGKLPGAAYIWGTFSGISSTLLHAGGPPITIYFLSTGISKRVWLAQAAMFFAFMNLVKVVPYSVNGVWQIELFTISILLVPVALLGVFIGYKIQGAITEVLFARSCRVLLGLTGSVLLIKPFLN